MIIRAHSHRPNETARSIFWGIKEYTPSMSQTFKSILSYAISDQAQFRKEVIDHFSSFGLASTNRAYKVSRATVYRWKKQFKDTQGKLASLVPKSTRPFKFRKMETDIRLLDFIRTIRELHPRIGKNKIKPLLDRYSQALNIKPISSSTIGKIIKHNHFYARNNRRVYHNPSSGFAKKKINYKTKVKYSPSIITSGYLEIDTIALFVEGVKRYLYHAIDVQNRFTFAYTYPNLNSQNTVDFLSKLRLVYPLTSGIKTIQTDNGLEFLGDFDSKLRHENIKHLFIYPRCPKINGFIERANRSLREEFIEVHLDLAVVDLTEFNRCLMNHLVWYNTERPHQSLRYLSPIDYLLKRYPESQMYVTRTRALLNLYCVI